MNRNLAIVLLSFLVVGVGLWGYQEHQEKNALLIQTENQYQNAFHALTYNMDILHDKLGATLAMNSSTQLSPALSEVWSLSSKTRGTLGQLPLSVMPFHDTEIFLTNIGDFINGTVVRDLDSTPLTKDEYNLLLSYYTQCEQIQNELRNVQTSLMGNQLKWNDFAKNYPSKTGDTTIADGFESIEKLSTGFTNESENPAFINLEKTRRNLSEIQGDKITEQQALEIAKKYSTFEDNSNANVVKSMDGSSYAFYSVTIVEPGTNYEIHMDILENGGAPVWYMNSEMVSDKKISLDEGAQYASKFLKDNGYENMEIYESTEYNNLGVYTFVYSKDNMRFYPDNVSVKVALNDGHILGFNAKDFLVSSRDRQVNKPVLTEEEARKAMNENLQVMEHRLALIENNMQQEVLCHEFLGTMNNDTYRIFINAENGMEEKVEKLTRSNKVYDGITVQES